MERRAQDAAEQGPWLQGVGVTDRSEREQELGAGKWTEEARTLEEVRASLSSEPIRELRISSGGFPWKLILLASLLLAATAIFFLIRGEEKALQGKRGGAPSAVEDGEQRSESQAAADAPEVTVWTDLQGAEVELDGRALGPAPVQVPVPQDTDLHELCITLGQSRTCRHLTGEQLAAKDPYAFTFGQ